MKNFCIFPGVNSKFEINSKFLISINSCYPWFNVFDILVTMQESNTIDDILFQLDETEKRLQPFLDAYDAGETSTSTWVTENDKACLAKVMRQIELARQSNKARQSNYSITPGCKALTSALSYLHRRRFSMSPLGSPLVSFLQSPSRTNNIHNAVDTIGTSPSCDSRSSSSSRRRRPSPLANSDDELLHQCNKEFLSEQYHQNKNTKITTTSVPATKTITLPTNTPSRSNISTITNNENNVKTGKQTGKKTSKKKKFGTILSNNTINNRTTKITTKKKNMPFKNRALTSSFENMNVLETF